MIYKLSGKIIEKNAAFIVVDVNGVAYEVAVSASTFNTLSAVGSNAEVYTYMVVREDGVFLFGFATLVEKETFLKLITVSGIGPKVAIKILGGVGVENLRNAIASKDYDLLTTIPGVGKKSAERIVVELKDKFEKLSMADNFDSGDVRADVASALVNFGYKLIDARKALEGFDKEDGFEKLLREALKRLSGKS